MDLLQGMRVFVSIVDQGSLIGAARYLDRTGPTIVRSLASLEQHLGVRLLQRTTRRQSLTPEGRIFLEHCRRVLAGVHEAEEAVHTNRDILRGPLRVTAPALFGARHLAPLITEFLREHPEIHIELLLLDRPVDLVDEGFDLALRIGQLRESNQMARRVGSLRRVTVAAQALLERVDRPETPGDLTALSCVQFGSDERAGSWLFDSDGSAQRVAVNGALRCNRADAAVNAVAAGLGFGQFLAYQVDDELRRGQLELLLESFEAEPAPVHLLYPNALGVTPRLRALLDHLAPRLRQRLSSLVARL